SPNGKLYYEVSGYFDCGKAGVSCQSSAPGLGRRPQLTAGDDGGQYDTAPFINCGKEPYSGTDAGKHPRMPDYIQQAGGGGVAGLTVGEFCIRVCEAGQMLEDPCNVKNDTLGCRRTMGVVFRDGFSYLDMINGTTGPTSSLSSSSTMSSSSTAAPSSSATPAPAPTQPSSTAVGQGAAVLGLALFIQDQYNFCIGLPDPASPVLQNEYYKQGRLPTIVQGEGRTDGVTQGNMQVYCVGSYLPPGALPMPAGAITAAHVIKNKSPNGKLYYEVSGYFDCGKAGVSCQSSTPGAGDDGGQYDTAPFRFCGKEPYSGTDAAKHPTMPNYVQQAGDGRQLTLTAR
ncbi:hypothetical protein HDU91_000933, partial [Kappamyces sp. JEL0680]